MALQKDTIARDAVEINGFFIEDLIPNGRYATLTASGREQVTYNTETETYNAKIINIKYVLSCATEAQFRTYSTYLQHVLNRKDADVVFNDEYDKFLIADIEDSGFTEKHGTWALGEFKLICNNPFKYSKQVKKITASQVSGTDDKQTTGSFRYFGTKATSPLIKYSLAKNSDQYGIISYDNNNSFLNALNSATNKSLSIGNIPQNTFIQASNLFILDMTKASTSSLLMNDWQVIGGSLVWVNTLSDPYFNRGDGLTYKAFLPSRYIASDSDWRNLNCGVYKNFSDNVNNFIFKFNLRMWAENPTDCGVIGIYTSSTINTNTGIFIVKNNMSTLSGTIYYMIDSKLVGSDTIDLSKYNELFGLSNREQASSISIQANNLRYFNDSVVNKIRKNTSIIQQKVVNNYVYTEPSLDVSISKLGDVYTFKIGDIITRDFVYKREDSQVLRYNKITLGFKNNLFYEESYADTYTMEMQITGISLLKLDDGKLLRNYNCLPGGTTYQIDTKKNSVYSGIENGTGVYSPEYQQDYSSIDQFKIDNATQEIIFEYFNTTASTQPEIELIFNEEYI